jgi:hypothetical protein
VEERRHGGGTVLVKDIAPGAGGSTPASLTVSGDKLFLVATDGTTGASPVATAARPAPSSSGHPSVRRLVPDGLRPANGVAYFTADDGTNGRGSANRRHRGGTTLAQTVVGAGSTRLVSPSSPGTLYLQATARRSGRSSAKIPVGVPDEVTIASIGGVTTNPVDFAPSRSRHRPSVPISSRRILRARLEPSMYSVGCTGTHGPAGLVSNGQSVRSALSARPSRGVLSTITKRRRAPSHQCRLGHAVPDQISAPGAAS